jgi:hypothetical protein
MPLEKSWIKKLTSVPFRTKTEDTPLSDHVALCKSPTKRVRLMDKVDGSAIIRFEHERTDLCQSEP